MKKPVFEQAHIQAHIDYLTELGLPTEHLNLYLRQDAKTTREIGEAVQKGFNDGVPGKAMVDTRYNVPKSEPKASSDLIDETINKTEIYRRARVNILLNTRIQDGQVKDLILNAQCRQVGYGIDKYPEALNADTWSIIETIDHAVDESIDKLHYLVMLGIKFEQNVSTKDVSNIFGDIGRMTSETINTLIYLVELRIKIEKIQAKPPTDVKRDDSLSTFPYALGLEKLHNMVTEKGVVMPGADLDGDYAQPLVFVDQHGSKLADLTPTGIAKADTYKEYLASNGLVEVD